VLTSLSYIPQVRKAWQRGSTSDLSLKMLVALTAGPVHLRKSEEITLAEII
jgi:MtN3 and saliva related transmembrane protein